MLLMLVVLDQSSSVVVQRYCISLLLCGEFLLGMLACRLGLSSKSSPTIMGVGAYLFGEGYPSPMFQSGDKSFTNVSARKMILHQ